MRHLSNIIIPLAVLVVILIVFSLLIMHTGPSTDVVYACVSIGNRYALVTVKTAVLLSDQARNCGLKCYNFPVLVFAWEKTPRVVVFTTRGLNASVVVLHVHRGTIVSKTAVPPETSITLLSWGDSDVFIEVVEEVYNEIGGVEFVSFQPMVKCGG